MRNLTFLNEAQLQAVTHPLGEPALVLAGPGSGKTAVIVNRICYLIEEQKVDPASILVITFTKAAALSMQKRFQNSISGKILPVNFGTFHSVFYQIIKRHKDLSEFTLLTNEEKTFCLKLAINVLAEDKREELNLMEVQKYIGMYKNNPFMTEEAFHLQEISFSEFKIVYEKYKQIINEKKRIDFEDMALLCLELFQRNESVLSLYQDKFMHILIDEYQDTNPIQNKIIKLLRANNKNVFIVGDDDQAIYGFRGSTPEIMKSFFVDFPQAKTYLLTINYRSTREIVLASSKVISENKKRFSKNIIAKSTNKGIVHCLGFCCVEEEYQYVISKAKDAIRQYGYNEIAVISRNNKELELLAQEFAFYQIPYHLKEKSKSTYEHFVVEDIISILNYCNNRMRRVPPIWQQLKGNEKQKNIINELQPFMAIRYIVRTLKYEKYLGRKAKNDRKNYIEWIERLNQLAKQAKKYYKSNEWIASMEEHLENWKQEQCKEGIYLLTMHGAKGLEFSHVFLIDINEGIIPSKQIHSLEEVEEERRMLYVGITRAKKVLDILYLNGTKEYPRLPSRFLNPLLK